MQPHKNTQKKPNQNHRRKRKPRYQPRRELATVSPPNVNVRVEDWGSTAEPWPETIGEWFVGEFCCLTLPLRSLRDTDR